MKNKLNKKAFITLIIVIIITLIIGLIIFVSISNNKKSNKDKLRENMLKLGTQFYEEFYYPSQEKLHDNIKEYVMKFEKSGIKVNLENIAKYSDINTDLLNTMVDEKCDSINTYVIIKPKEPFGKSNYNMEVNLSCNFNKKD